VYQQIKNNNKNKQNMKNIKIR